MLSITFTGKEFSADISGISLVNLSDQDRCAANCAVGKRGGFVDPVADGVAR